MRCCAAGTAPHRDTPLPSQIQQPKTARANSKLDKTWGQGQSKSNFTEEFKLDTVRQITERGYPVAEVSQRLGVSQHSLYEWKKKFAASNAKGNDEAEEIRRLKKELARVTEERDILKKAAAYFARDAK